MEYYIKAILLEDCVYSIRAKELLELNKIKSDIINISSSEKDKYKTNQIYTFPQIYLCKHDKGSLLLGGCSDLEDFIYNFKGNTYDNVKIDEFISKYGWSKNATLRLIKIINI
jgi:glutaredoxin